MEDDKDPPRPPMSAGEFIVACVLAVLCWWAALALAAAAGATK